MKRFLCATTVLFLLASHAAPVNADQVHLRFFHTECHECDVVREMLNILTNEYYPFLVVHDHDFMVRTNYTEMLRLEQALGIDANEPVAIYIGTNAYYGLKAIRKNLEPGIRLGLEGGGVPLWYPSGSAGEVSAGEDLLVTRFRSFSLPLVIGAGLLDGINPCAFATLVLFVTLLSSYHTTRKEIILTSLVFCGAIFMTYVLLGLGLLTIVEQIALYALPSLLLHWAVILLCVILAGLSIRDAWRVYHTHSEHHLALSLPDGWRRTISRLLSRYVGHTRWLAGVFGVGVIIALVESVCTGQVYLPTLLFVMRSTTHFGRAILYLIIYNAMFIAPIMLLTGIVLFGIRSQRLLAWQQRHAVAARIVMASLFSILALLLAATGLV